MDLYEKMVVQIERNYTCIAEYKFDNKKDVFLGNKERPRRCRFCGKMEPDVHFQKVAHTIPHFIGNRTLKSLYECDNCNEKVFSPMESHFSRFMGLYHVLSHVSRGGKVSTYKTDSNSNSKIIVGDEWTDIYCYKDEAISYKYDREKKSITISSKRSYIPIAVYKLFVKMALSIMPEEEMNYFHTTLTWLMNGSISLPHSFLIVRIYQSLLPCNGKCMLYKRKTKCVDNVPGYLFGLSYNNIFIQNYLPLCDNDKTLHGSITMPLIPCESDKEGYKFIYYDYDLSSNKKVYGENVSLSFSYENLKEPKLDLDNEWNHML